MLPTRIIGNLMKIYRKSTDAIDDGGADIIGIGDGSSVDGCIECNTLPYSIIG